MAEEVKETKEIKKLDWMKMKPAELEKIVVELYKQGESLSKIGLILRDKYGIPKAKLLGRKIKQVLLDAKIHIMPEKEIAQKKIDMLNKHIEKNKHDQPTRKKLAKQLWAIKKIQ